MTSGPATAQPLHATDGLRSLAPPHRRRQRLGRAENSSALYNDLAPLSTYLKHQLTASGCATINDERFAEYLDRTDRLQEFAHEFHKPQAHDVWTDTFKRRIVGLDVAFDPKPAVYFAGNSLGLCPRKVRTRMNEQLDVWATKAVLGHTENPIPRFNWLTIETLATATLAKLVGAPPSCVVAMGTLTANLHTLLSAFYRPTATRYKILYEAKAFPSDSYAFASQVALHGHGRDALVELAPAPGQWCLSTEAILDTLDRHGHEIAVVCLSGVQYYTGQLFDMQTITMHARSKGCLVGWDLAHAVGNVPLRLHDWGVDFATWCSYKYLCAGPGAIAGLYVHNRHEHIKKLQGWWGHDLKTRFDMPSHFSSQPGAAGWQHSNPSVYALLPLVESLQLFERAGIVIAQAQSGSQTHDPPSNLQWGLALREKSLRLTDYLEALLVALPEYLDNDELRARLDRDEEDVERSAPSPASADRGHDAIAFTIITPDRPWRGAQLSLLFHPLSSMPAVFECLREKGVLGDERQPGAIRLSPCPLYNTCREVHEAVEALKWALGAASKRLEAQAGRNQLLGGDEQSDSRADDSQARPAELDDVVASAHDSGSAGISTGFASASNGRTPSAHASSTRNRKPTGRGSSPRVARITDSGLTVEEAALAQRRQKLQSRGPDLWQLPTLGDVDIRGGTSTDPSRATDRKVQNDTKSAATVLP